MAAALLARSARLTPDPARRAARYLGAADGATKAGDPVEAREDLTLAMPALADPVLVVQARQLDAAIRFDGSMHNWGGNPSTTGRVEDSPALMIDAALAMNRFDTGKAREAALDALLIAIYFGEAATMDVRDIARAARALALPPSTAPTSADLVLDGLVLLFADGYRSAVPILRDGVSAMRSDPTAREVPRALPNGCMAAFALGDDESVAAMDGEWIALMRDRGALGLLSQGLYHLGARELRVGTLARAEVFFSEDDEIQALRRQKGSGVVGKLIVTAWRGREEEARATAAELVSEHDGYGRGWNLSQIDHAMSVLELSLGNYHAAALLNPDGTLPTLGNDLALAPLRAADAVEAHVRGGDRRVADAVVDWLSERATANQSALELGLLAGVVRCSRRTTRPKACTRKPSDGSGRARRRSTSRRAQLLFGEWLRRQKRRREAREQLRASIDIFESMGAGAFAERARVELLATGASARRRVDETRDDLTPQEEQIARLAADAATNAEIAARLFISPNTVDYHLRKVYRKLGINSRRELARTALADN